MTTSEPHWMALLRAEAQRTSMRAVASALGYSPTTVSLVLSGKYPGKTDRIAKAVLALLDVVECPHIGQSMPLAECHGLALAPAPTHHPMKLSHWRACQGCPHRPKGE
ncbi:XRE family transcriptional regulator [Paludibacterium sp. B53371]|uniref:XRE family transcriptional regulator n=1 Tax=Paludibacterium sp. B53371 TaxID=2806263 RepID=UPI001C05D370|nr:XRE family transcriptional regulator [Paludibacterium sp. B53371]